MKKVFFIIALLANFQIVFAQTEKGKFIIGSTIEFSLEDNKKMTEITPFGASQDQSNLFNVSPTVGYFFKKNHLIGGGLLFTKGNGSSNYLYFPTSSQTISHHNVYSYGAQLFYKRYFPLTKRLYLVPEFGVSIQQGKTQVNSSRFADFSITQNQTSEDRFTRTQLFGRLNMSYFVSKKLSLDVGLGSLEWNHVSVKRNYQTFDHINQVYTTIKSKDNITEFNTRHILNNLRLGFKIHF
jgi:hypothetical protein